MLRNLTTEQLTKIKSRAKTGIVIGALITIVSTFIFFEADHELSKLDQTKLDEPMEKGNDSSN